MNIDSKKPLISANSAFRKMPPGWKDVELPSAEEKGFDVDSFSGGQPVSCADGTARCPAPAWPEQRRWKTACRSSKTPVPDGRSASLFRISLQNLCYRRNQYLLS